MEFKTDALVLRTTDYGEYDKMVTLLTAERGKIGACLKGVRRANAKLKFAAQPFCFAEFVLAARAARYTVISASLHDGFYPLRERITAYYAAAATTECCDALLPVGLVNPEMLLLAVRALGDMCGEAPAAALVRFLVGAAALAGYPVRADEADCTMARGGRLGFLVERGCFVGQGEEHALPASESTCRALAAAARGELSRDPDGIRRALRLLAVYLAEKADVHIGALVELDRLL